MKDDELFIEQWEKKRQAGKRKYILINGVGFCIVYWGVISLFFIATGKGVHKLIENMDLFLIFTIIYIMSLFRVWKKNENKYNRLIGKK